MQAYERTNFRRELDEAMLPFRMVVKRKGKSKMGWLKSVRQATGMPEEELARRLGVSEVNSRIMLGTLRRAAEGLGCELVYALVPKQGTLEDLAAEQDGVREQVLARKQGS